MYIVSTMYIVMYIVSTMYIVMYIFLYSFFIYLDFRGPFVSNQNILLMITSNFCF